MKKYPTEAIKAITEFLFIGKSIDNLKEFDLIIVLGNDFIDGTASELSMLYKKGVITPKTKVILTGANGSLNKNCNIECDSLYNLAVNKYNLPSEIFIKESKATNLYLNFLYSKEIIEEMGGFKAFNNILCIGYAFALRRASMCASKLKYPIDKLNFYGTVNKEGRNIGPDTWWLSKISVERVMAEIERIGKYGADGDLSIF